MNARCAEESQVAATLGWPELWLVSRAGQAEGLQAVATLGKPELWLVSRAKRTCRIARIARDCRPDCADRDADGDAGGACQSHRADCAGLPPGL